MLDYKNFELLGDKLKKFNDKFDKFLHDFLLTEALKCLAQTKKRTPVDTGTLRRNWDIDRVIKGEGHNLIVEIFNPIEYASYVEYGHITNTGRRIPGVYMCTISINEIEQKMPAAFDETLKNWLKTL